MAYKQTPGRSPFLKTGRDIPLNMISPLHKEKKTPEVTNMGGKPAIMLGSEGDVGITSFTKHEEDKLKKELQYNIKAASGISTGLSGKTIDPNAVRNDPWFQKNRPLDRWNTIKPIEKQLERGGKGMVPGK